jgi:Ca-activated chloride channel family protein
MNSWFPIAWGAKHNSMWLPLFFVALLLLIYRLIKKQRSVKKLTGLRLTGLVRNFSVPRNIIKMVCMSLGILCLLIALLHPQWSRKEQVVSQRGRDVFIALDVSRSMLATDCAPNRLACAKEKIKKLVRSLSCERVGLILFSGSAFVQCPLTDDYGAFFMFLDQVDVETISSGTTALDQALKITLDAFAGMPKKKNKLLIIFTDGEDFSSNLRGLKQQAQEANLRIFAFGVGTSEGAPIPLFDEHGKSTGHQKDEYGKIVISRLNDGILRTLAQDAGGKYLSVTQDSSDVHQLVSSIESFEKEHLDDKSVSELEEQYQYFLLASFFLFALEWLL